MTIEPLSSLSSALSALSGGAPTLGAAVGAGARTVAFRVVGEVGDMLLATLSGQSAAHQPRSYGIQELAETLGQSMGATPLEVMDLEQALGNLAGAVAADLVALADGRTLDRLDAALTASSGSEGLATPAQVSQEIQYLAAQIAASR